jgi:peroxiredoxin Q/BCP
MAKLNIGDRAPDFALTSNDGTTVTLASELAKGPVVLIFYPMDNTPGCTAQLCAARDDAARYASAGTTVFGVNNGGAASHERFREKHGLTAPLLVDAGLKTATAYDAVMGAGPLKFINRTVVGIAPDGTIAFYKRGAPKTDEILGALTAKA